MRTSLTTLLALAAMIAWMPCAADATVIVDGWTVIDNSFADDASGTYAEVGADWFSSTNNPNDWNNNYRYNDAGNGSETATWSFVGLADGFYEVAVSWAPQGNRATDSPYSINGGTPFDVNQELTLVGPPLLFDGSNDIPFLTISSGALVNGGCPSGKPA